MNPARHVSENPPGSKVDETMRNVVSISKPLAEEKSLIMPSCRQL
jgi:hypothetical protein